MLNRQTAKSYPAGAQPTVNTTYDLAGRPLSVKYAASGQGVTYAYEAATGRLLTETTNNGANRAMAYQYDAAGNRTKVTWPDAANFWVTYSYDPLNRMSTISEKGSTLLASFNYDDLGRRIGIDRLGQTTASTTYSYDTDDRLTALNHVFPNAGNNQTWGFGYNSANQETS